MICYLCRFIVKYMGCRPCDGLWGVKVVRDPVDEMVAELKQLDKEKDDLPLINIEVSATSLNATLHRANASLRPNTGVGRIPLEFIPYAVQVLNTCYIVRL